MPHALRTLVFGVVFNLALASPCAFAQSGSVGGSIGNDEKSLGSLSGTSSVLAPQQARSGAAPPLIATQ